MSELKTKVTKTESGLLIENPFATKVKIHTDFIDEGFVEIPQLTLFQIMNFLYVGENTERDGRLGFRSKAVSELNYWFNTKKTFKFWRNVLRPAYEEHLKEIHDKQKREMEEI
tara:strand:+ start:152 stop:490 length:339 start_codon:yes stop_codon:yes gene_type:complete